MGRLWLSPRALKLHAVILVVVPAFMAMCLWQLSRALGGNELSWAYVFEWPLFAGYAIYMWWRLLHESPDVARSAGAVPGTEATGRGGGVPPQLASDGTPAQPGSEETSAAAGDEDPELAAYNEFLGRLAAQDRARGH